MSRAYLSIFYTVLVAMACLVGCGGHDSPSAPSSGSGPNSGPWMGRWIQVNFLTLDDGGVWDPDDLSGIGFVQELTETEWTLTDDFGRGCSVTLTYSVDANHRFSRQAIRAGAQCPSGIIGMRDSGRFEFSSDSRFMTEHYDLQPGDDIVAFKWLSR